jgi:hypothetical protein
MVPMQFSLLHEEMVDLVLEPITLPLGGLDRSTANDEPVLNERWIDYTVLWVFLGPLNGYVAGCRN